MNLKAVLPQGWFTTMTRVLLPECTGISITKAQKCLLFIHLALFCEEEEEDEEEDKKEGRRRRRFA